VTVTPVSAGSLEVRILVDAGRFGASRIKNIATGWSEAISAVGDLNPFAHPVAGSIMATADLAAGSLLFAQLPDDPRGSAEMIKTHGHELASRRDASRTEADDPSMFARSLAQACAAASKTAPAGRRRLVAVYRAGFSETGSRDERMVLEELSAHSPGSIDVLLVGQRLSGTPSGCVRLWSLPLEALRSPSTVAAHAWAVMASCAGAWWHSMPPSPSVSAGARLVCDSCGSASEWQEIGEHCPVCHMGHMRVSPCSP
jgi:hypothetical protein